MVIEKLRQVYSITILFYILIELIFILIFGVTTLIYRDFLTQSLILLLFGSLMISFLTIKHINNHYQEIMRKNVRVISLSQKLNYPTYFKKKKFSSLLMFNRAYIHNHKIIPVKFISFIEGNVCYPIKEFSEIELNNHYQILHIHHGYAALIQDMNNKKYVIHLNNLESIE